MPKFSPVISKLISELGQLPGIGAKTAQRLAFHILAQPDDRALALARAIEAAKQEVHFCSSCYNLTEQDPCPICSDEDRDRSLLCVEEQANDLAAIERTGGYHGLYHVLHGALNPNANMTVDKLKLRELFQRLNEHPEIEEVILAMNATVEGEATATYIQRLLLPAGIRISRLAHGLAMGSNLEYTDEVTLIKAFEGRRVYQS